jgi:hypothetical protein
MDGVPFRKLGDEHGLSGGQVYNRVKAELTQLPDNTALTKLLCDPAQFCGILVMDGKYASVKGFEIKIPFIYGIDYLTHDIPLGDLYACEDELSFSVFFAKLKQLGYRLTAVVVDDRKGLKRALHKVFPHAKLQLCHTHYLEKLRRDLNVRTVEKYRNFFNSLRLNVFLKAANQQQVVEGLRLVWNTYAKHKRTLQNILLEINHRREDLFNYLQISNCPNSTNLIELYNSHLNGRLKTIKGFQSFESAKRWLNGYLIRRRTKELTDCDAKFRHLNKHASLELTIKKQAQWPDVLTELNVKKIEYYEN